MGGETLPIYNAFNQTVYFAANSTVGKSYTDCLLVKWTKLCKIKKRPRLH